jgi:dTDP-4-dehydrorhamnose reductase
MSTIDIWGGIECTINRVGQQFHDQLRLSGHYDRKADLAQIAELGIKTLRYPVLWEHVAPNGLKQANWSWTDERLHMLRALGIRPIVGLLHHGSGPAYTDLTDPDFADKFTEYAHAVAERYPWIDAYTPINEPLTTARFSGLYGFWYPHGKDDETFAHIILNQSKATVLAMNAIRAINPTAQLIQTEDYGRTDATPLLQYQANFENERRCLGFDLLCGQLHDRMPMWHYLIDHTSLNADDLHWYTDNPCPPDIMGINYYATSDRYLDENWSFYPYVNRGSNGRHEYADVESVRTPQGLAGYSNLLTALWARYQRPLAITEVHLNCTREEQVRWLEQCHQSLTALKQDGLPIYAMTVWALLGAFNWQCLLTQNTGCYEPGAFDLRSPAPRPTMVCDWIRQKTQLTPYTHPVLSQPGWWARPEGQLYPKQPINDTKNVPYRQAASSTEKPLLITGATGTLGNAFARLCQLRGLPYVLTSRSTMDLSDYAAIEKQLDTLKPWAVINAAGYVRVDDAEQDNQACFHANVNGPVHLATACHHYGLPLVHFSTDLVFDGLKKQPYVETDVTAPLNYYGYCKRLAEKRVLEILPKALLVRTGGFFGPWDAHNWVTTSLTALKAGKAVILPSDCISSLTYVPDLVNTTLDLLLDNETGLWHLTNDSPGLSWYELVKQAARLCQIPLITLHPGFTKDMHWRAKRPPYCLLTSEKAYLMPGIANALTRYAEAVMAQYTVTEANYYNA